MRQGASSVCDSILMPSWTMEANTHFYVQITTFQQYRLRRNSAIPVFLLSESYRPPRSNTKEGRAFARPSSFTSCFQRSRNLSGRLVARMFLPTSVFSSFCSNLSHPKMSSNRPLIAYSAPDHNMSVRSYSTANKLSTCSQ
jgi:hypothetical protein